MHITTNGQRFTLRKMRKMALLMFLLVFIQIVCGHLVLHVDDEDHDCDNNRLQKLEADLAEIKGNVTDLRNKVETKEITKKGCKDGWTVFYESCYFFGNTNLAFSDAENFCKGLDTHLANVETSAENSFLRDHLRNWKGTPHWFGMTDEQSENVWKHFPAGVQATFFAWHSVEPNQGRAANCVVFWHDNDYLWADEPCTNKYKPICEQRAQ